MARGGLSDRVHHAVPPHDDQRLPDAPAVSHWAYTCPVGDVVRCLAFHVAAALGETQTGAGRGGRGVSQLTAVSLFSGIGGIDLGLERAGMRIVAQVEIDEWCRRVLAKHWPDVPRFGDIRDITGDELPPADVVAGGFPCQSVSLAGRRQGQDDARWLWPEFVRIIRLVRPRYVLVENVPGLLGRGMGIVLGELAEAGFDAEWSCVSACSMGAPHMRRRVFVVAYPQGQRCLAGRCRTSHPPAPEPERCRPGTRGPWSSESRPVGVAYGVPDRLERLRGAGNAVVPAVVEHIGRMIVEAAS